MEAKKSMVILFCLDKLLTEHKFYKKDLEQEFGVSKPAFDRYKKDIRAYLAAYRPDCKLRYKRSIGVYYLSTKAPN